MPCCRPPLDHCQPLYHCHRCTVATVARLPPLQHSHYCCDCNRATSALLFSLHHQNPVPPLQYHILCIIRTLYCCYCCNTTTTATPVTTALTATVPSLHYCHLCVTATAALLLLLQHCHHCHCCNSLPPLYHCCITAVSQAQVYSCELATTMRHTYELYVLHVLNVWACAISMLWPAHERLHSCYMPLQSVC